MDAFLVFEAWDEIGDASDLMRTRAARGELSCTERTEKLCRMAAPK